MEVLNDINVKESVGFLCKTTRFGNFKILEYGGCNDVYIEFLDTGYKTKTSNKEVRYGNIRDRLKPSVFNVGFIGNKYKTSVNHVDAIEYKIWYSMLERCYSEKVHNVRNTYKDCEVSENVKSYEYFYQSANKQVGFNVKGFDLDKDLLTKGCKVYSENSCVFLPSEINTLIIKCDKVRGDCPVGVTYHKSSNNYAAQISMFGKRKHLGMFNTKLEAFNSYKKAKECHIKELANKWESEIDERAYNALMNYQVEITD